MLHEISCLLIVLTHCCRSKLMQPSRTALQLGCPVTLPRDTTQSWQAPTSRAMQVHEPQEEIRAPRQPRRGRVASLFVPFCVPGRQCRMAEEGCVSVVVGVPWT